MNRKKTGRAVRYFAWTAGITSGAYFFYHEFSHIWPFVLVLAILLGTLIWGLVRGIGWNIERRVSPH